LLKNLLSALFDERTGLLFRIASGPRQRSHSQVLVPRDPSYFTEIQDSANLNDQVPVFISPRNRAQLYTKALGSPFVASEDSQGCVTATKLCYDHRSVGQSISVSNTHLRSKTRFYYCHATAGLLTSGILSEDRPRQRSHIYRL
jgi:hypothetical protein